MDLVKRKWSNEKKEMYNILTKDYRCEKVDWNSIHLFLLNASMCCLKKEEEEEYRRVEPFVDKLIYSFTCLEKDDSFECSNNLSYNIQKKQNNTLINEIMYNWKILKQTLLPSPKITNKPSNLDFLKYFRSFLQGKENTLLDNPSVDNYSLKISIQELKFFLNKLKEGKSTGPDEISVAALKYASDNVHKSLLTLINDVLAGKEVPESWCVSRIFPVYKKDSPDLPSNYRPIAICNSIYKLITTIINHMLYEYVEENDIIPESQFGFRKDRSSVDAAYILNQCVQKQLCRVSGRMYTAFVDFEKAFDSVDREKLFDVLERLNIPKIFIKIIKNLYKSTIYTVGKNKFRSFKGLKQGCPLSPLLFNLYTSHIEEMFKKNNVGGVLVVRHKIHLLSYADDLVLISENAKDLQCMLYKLTEYCNEKKLIINTKKTKILMFSKGSRMSNTELKIGDEVIEEVKTFKYLGIVFQQNGLFTAHKKETVDKANERINEVNIISESLFKENFKIRHGLFNYLVTPILLNGSEIIGFDNTLSYEVLFKKYIKHVLNLPENTPDINLIEKCGNVLDSIFYQSSKRAIAYESNIYSRSPILLRNCIALSQQWNRSRNSTFYDIPVKNKFFILNGSEWDIIMMRTFR